MSDEEKLQEADPVLASTYRNYLIAKETFERLINE